MSIYFFIFQHRNVRGYVSFLILYFRERITTKYHLLLLLSLNIADGLGFPVENAAEKSRSTRDQTSNRTCRHQSQGWNRRHTERR